MDLKLSLLRFCDEAGVNECCKIIYFTEMTLCGWVKLLLQLQMCVDVVMLKKSGM